jgi:hypothetical protein
VETATEVQKEHFAKEWTVSADHIFDVFREILFQKDCSLVVDGSFNLISFCASPETVKCVEKQAHILLRDAATIDRL